MISPEFFQQYESEATNFDVDAELDRICNGDWESKLQTESFEEAESALKELKALNEWRVGFKQSSFRDFYQFFEAASNINRQQLPPDQQTALRVALVDRLIERSRTMSPRVRDFYQALLADFEGRDYQPRYPITQQEIQKLKEADELTILEDPNIPYTTKLNRIKSRMEGLLGGKKSYDFIDRQKQIAKSQEETEEIQEQPQTPPPAQDESLAQSYEREKGEGGVVYWTILPGFGGYQKEQSFDSWDEERNIWKQSQYNFSEARFSNNQDKVNQIQGSVKTNQWTRVPKSYVRGFVNINASSGVLTIRQDQNGDYVFIVQDETSDDSQITIYLSEDNQNEFLKTPASEAAKILSKFTDETVGRLEEIKRTKKGNLAMAQACASWAIRQLKYPSEGKFDQTYNSYRQESEGYIEAIDRYRLADCKVGNTYFAALCSSLNIPVRHVTGHMVKGKDDQGNSRITSGTGHAWSEVWDDEQNIWVRIDATPAGDPLLEEEQPDDQSVKGDYGEREVMEMTDEELLKLQEKFEKQLQELEKQKQTPEAKFAEEAGCTVEKAREIIDKIKELKEKYKNVTQEAQSYWQEIVRKSLSEKSVYRGPVLMSQGEELDDPGLAGTDLASGQLDPDGFTLERKEQKKLTIFGGFEIYLAADTSGSMDDTIDNIKKCDSQRDMIFLYIDSVMRARNTVKDQEANLLAPLPTKVSVISFGEDIEIILPLTDQWGAKEQFMLYHALDAGASGGTPDDQALALIEEEVVQSKLKEQETRSTNPKIIQSNIDWQTRRFVTVVADGGSDNQAAVKQSADSLRQGGTIVDLFLITPENDQNAITNAQTAYGKESVIPINNPQELARKGIRQLINNLKKAYQF